MKRIISFILIVFLCAVASLSSVTALDNYSVMINSMPYLQLFQNGQVQGAINFGAPTADGYYLNTSRIDNVTIPVHSGTEASYGFITFNMLLRFKDNEAQDNYNFSSMTQEGITYTITDQSYPQNDYWVGVGDWANVYIRRSLENNISTYTFFIVVRNNSCDIKINFDSRNQTDGYFNITTSAPTIVSSYGTNSTVISNQIDDLISAVEALARNSSVGNNEIVQAFANVGADITTNAENNAKQISDDLDRVYRTIDTLSKNVPSKVEEGLENYYERETEKTVDKGDKTVNAVLEKIPFVNTFNSAKNFFENFITAITDTSTDAVLAFPAGTVTIGGEEFTFWQENNISFSDWTDDNNMIILLYGLRFITFFSMLLSVIHWCNKIIRLFLME